MKKSTLKNIVVHQNNNRPYNKLQERLNPWKTRGEYHVLIERERSGLFSITGPDCPFLYNCFHIADLPVTKKGVEPNALLRCEHLPYDGLPDKLDRVDNNIATPARFWSPKGNVSLRDLVHRRCYIPPYHWVEAPLTSDDKVSISIAIARVVNTRSHDYTVKINWLLDQNHCPSIFERVVLSRHNGTFYWEYIAGQDYTQEISTIRRYFRNL
jgi:hypothetical protein